MSEDGKKAAREVEEKYIRSKLDWSTICAYSEVSHFSNFLEHCTYNYSTCATYKVWFFILTIGLSVYSTLNC